MNICKKEKIKYEEQALMEIAILADGCMRDGLSLLDQISRVNEKVSLSIIREYFGLVTQEDIDEIYMSIINNDINTLVKKINDIKQTGVDVKNLIEKLIKEFIDKAISIKKKGISNNVFKQLKNMIDRINELLAKLNQNSDGYLLLELELISFIKDDEIKISKKEVNQIISQEIIKVDTKIDVNTLLKPEEINHYKLNDKFIETRINNTFVGASKENKVSASEKWTDFINYVNDNGINEYKLFKDKVVIAAASEDYIILQTGSESLKTIGNSKLYDIEQLFNNKNNTNYKFIFIKADEWKNIVSKFDKNKTYKLIDESEFIQVKDSSIDTAKDLFGKNIDIQ